MRPARVWLTLGAVVFAGCGTALGPDPSQGLDGVQDALTTAERGLLGGDARLWRTWGRWPAAGSGPRPRTTPPGATTCTATRNRGARGRGPETAPDPRRGGDATRVAFGDPPKGVWALDAAGQGAVPGVSARRTISGRSGDAEVVALESTRDLRLNLYVSAWAAVDAAFRPRLGRDVKYQLDVQHRCP